MVLLLASCCTKNSQLASNSTMVFCTTSTQSQGEITGSVSILSACRGMRCGFLVFALVATSLHLSNSVVSPPRVVDAWLDGATTSSIATTLSCSQRHVQKLLAVEGLGQSRLPLHPRLAVVVSREVARHGANYGVKMLLGALHAHHPGFRFPRRKVLRVMKACNPTAFHERRRWAKRRSRAQQ